MRRAVLACFLLLGCNGGSDLDTGTEGGTSTGAANSDSTADDGADVTTSGTSEVTSTSALDPTSTGVPEPTTSTTTAGDEESSSSTGGPPGPTSAFCECSTENPAPDAGSFEMCAELLPDGSGTYYEPPPYSRTDDANAVDGVPVGMVTSGTFSDSTVYPGVSWSYWVYVPAQYDAREAAALMVLTDGGVYRGGAYETPTVLDNLIAEGAMPVTIAVFVDPGQAQGGQSQRSLEYDTPSDDYVRFVLDDLLPAVTGEYVITDDPSLRAIGGRSSGGAAAFTAGWERPDAFGLIYTTLGSFVQLRANEDGEFSDKYPAEIAETERKPLRVTLLSGINDVDNQFGNWRDAHMDMTTALDCAGYTYRSGFGESSHGDNSHPNHAFGDDLRWLFADAG